MAKHGEIGRIGQRRTGGISGTFFEEFVPELAGKRGVEVYKEMSENDDVLNAVIFAIENLIRQCEFSIEKASDSDVDVKAAEFVDGCLNDMKLSWQDTLSEILSFLVYGWSYHEIVYKRRIGGKTSKFDDGLIGWKGFPIRAQETLYEWRFADNSDELLGMVQIPPPDYVQAFIPIEKALHFRTRSRKDNPEGRSILRGSYRSWYFKKRLQEIEGIGIERDLAGYPFIQPPEGTDLWDEEDEEMVEMRKRAEEMIRNVRRDEMEGMVLPFGWNFELLNSGSRRQFEVGSVIDRYDRRMAMTVLADFLFMGQQSVGSFALSSDKTRLFSLAIGTYLDIICEVFNKQAIPRLMDLNSNAFKGMTDYPQMIHGDVEDANLDKYAGFLSAMVGAGIIIPDPALEKYARNLANIPVDDEVGDDYSAEDKEDEEKRMAILGVTPQQPEAGAGAAAPGAPGDPSATGNTKQNARDPRPKSQRQTSDNPPDPDAEAEKEEKKEVEKAKKLLGR